MNCPWCHNQLAKDDEGSYICQCHPNDKLSCLTGEVNMKPVNFILWDAGHTMNIIVTEHLWCIYGGYLLQTKLATGKTALEETLTLDQAAKMLMRYSDLTVFI